MNRRVFTCLSAMSLILCLALVGLYVLNYWKSGWVKCTLPPRQYCLASHPGRISFGMYKEVVPPSPTAGGSLVPLTKQRRFKTWYQSVPSTDDIHGYYLPEGVTMHKSLGFVFIDHLPPAPNGDWTIMIPHPYLIVAAAILPTWWLLSSCRTWRRRHAGDVPCPKCGYDLRANRDQCPECGTPIEASHNNAMKLTGQATDVHQSQVDA